MTVAPPADGPGAAGGSRPLLAKPVAWEQVWASDGMGPFPPDKEGETKTERQERNAKRRVTLWRPLPPEGYAALGCVAVRGGREGVHSEPPHVPEFRCVRVDCTQPSSLASKVWDDAGTRKAKVRCSVWQAENAASTFLAHGGSRDAPSAVNGAAAGLERWTAVVSIVLQPPRTEERLRKNPLGIYVNGLSWSRELDSSEGVKP